MITSIEQAMDFIRATSWKGMKPGLSRITELCALLGNPQERLSFVHVAGTNGKGSTCAMTASILRKAGYRTGLFTSPPIYGFGERIQINGEHISNDCIIKYAEEIRLLSGKMQELPTEFEVITALALMHFAQENCDIVVFEVGMGGAMDSTNVIPAPLVAVITSIGLDHTEFLGDTVEKIAAEKTGIIKNGCVVVAQLQKDSVAEVICKKCHAENADLIQVDTSYDHRKFSYKNLQDIKLNLHGDFQTINAACVIEVCRILSERGFEITESHIRSGLANTYWPGRFEYLTPRFILDVAHNPAGIQTFVETFTSRHSVKPVCIFGVLSDKDYRQMAQILSLYAKKIITVTPDDPRGLSASDLANCIRKYNSSENFAVPCDSTEDAVELAFSLETYICAVGSLTTAGKVRDIISGRQ